jgi:hypothetical protein
METFMRKRLINSGPPAAEPWLDLETLARVEISSEDATHPIEFALTDRGGGWKAAHDGEHAGIRPPLVA